MSGSDSSVPSYKLTYFDGRSRAETTRLIFVAAGVDYIDNRIKDSDWPKMKAGTPFGKLPILEIDGKVLAQSHAIEHFIARQYGLAGKTHYEQAVTNMIALGIEEMFVHFDAIFVEENGTKKIQLLTKYEEERSKHLKYLTQLLQTHSKKSGHFIGSDLTYADLAFFNYADLQTSFGAMEIDEDEFPELQSVVDTVKNYPKVKEYLAKRHVQPY